MKRWKWFALVGYLLFTVGFVVENQASDIQGQLLFTNGDIMLVNADGSNARNLTASDAYDSSPSWSPDREQIAYISNLDGNFYGQYAVMVMDVNGENQRQLADDATYGSFPEWSPEGAQIAYRTQANTGDCLINLVEVERAEGRELVRLPHKDCDPLSKTMDWSPDGLIIAFDYDLKQDYNHYQIFTVTPADGTMTQITQTHTNEQVPRWSPDGKQIAFISDRDKQDELYVMEADGSNVQRVTHRPDSDAGVHWLPDGQTLLFSSYPREYDLFTIGTDGLHLNNLTFDFGPAAWAAALSPDSQQVVFSYGEDPISGPEGIGIVNIDGSNLHTLTGLAPGFYLSWQPRPPEPQ